jgi:two-component system chemotaxis sensor kinase CheA
MRSLDDLITAFRQEMPARVAQATELWLGFEEGRQEKLPVLRRLLHTIKGEAQMLEQASCAELAERAEYLVEALRKAGEVTPLTGDALLGTLEAMAIASSEDAAEEPPDLEPVLAQIREAIIELENMVAVVEGRPSIPPPTIAARESDHPSHAPRTAAALLKADEVRPLVHEMRRLYGEQTVSHGKLREIQRMLRALLIEIDPRQGTENLAERITKTLGYGSEIDRRMSAVRSEWSGNEFALGLTLDELESSVRRASVVSTDQLLNHVRRVARSTARTLNKDVEVRVRGDAIMDAAVERRLEPALLHLVRNAIDHGIESAEVRRERGKPARGTIEVSMGQTETSVTVEVTDDGGGVDFERLRAVLAKRVPDAASLRNEDLLPYLFEQGVTTSRQVTAISGRGVGLDVVAREVSAAGGQVRVESTPPNGTRIVLHLPTTLRAELAIPVVCGKQRYAVPSRSIFSVIKLERIDTSDDGDWIRVQNGAAPQIIRLFSLKALLGGDGRPKVGEAAIVLYHAAGLYAVSVEGYDNPRPITVQRSDEMPFGSPLVRGVAATPDGGVLLLLDVEAVYAASRGTSHSRRGSAETQRGQARALVVEDAPVARELLCGILRSIGLRVEEATDGRQGLAMARNDPPNVVLTDLEMPYMDGIEMISHFRKSTALARVPVIVLSTASNAENRTKLAQLGVTAVLSKQKFVEAELREWIDRCLKTPA